jgi:hypothetical protein
MPKIEFEHDNRGLVQSTGSGLFLFSGAQAVTANASADAAIISATGGNIVTVTSGAAARIVHLPAISADTVGLTFLITVAGNGFELRGNNESTDLLNGASGGGTVELAVEANSSIICVCTSATGWAVVGPHAASVAG